MIELINKEYLWLLLPVFAIGIFLVKTEYIKKFEVAVVFVVIVLIVFSLSRPVLNKGEQVFYKKDTEILIMIDYSLSMGVKDYKPDRLTFALKKAVKLAEKLKEEKLGLLIFADQPEILTFPYEKTEKTVNILKTIKLEPSGSTDILSAFSTANSVLTGKERVVILISDGSDEDLEKIKELVKQSGIKFVFYGVATFKGGKVPGHNAVSRLNTQMVQIAQDSGLYVKPTKDSTDIQKIYQYIHNISEKTKTVLLKVSSKTDLSPFITGLSLLIIFVGYMIRRLMFAFLLFMLINPAAYGGELKGLLYYITGNYEKAAEEFLEDKKPQNMYNAALLYYKKGMYGKALNILKSIKTEDPHLLKKVKYTVALCYLAQKKFEKAREKAEELILLFPEEKRIKKLYLFTNFLLNTKKDEERRKTVVRIKEKESRIFKTSPAQVGEKNPW